MVTDESEGDGGTLLGIAELDNEVDVSCEAVRATLSCHSSSLFRRT